MRPDGELYTFDSNGNYDQLNTGNAQTFVTTQSDGITCYELNQSTNTVVPEVINGTTANVVFSAMAYGPSADGQWPVYAIGSQSSGNDGTVPFTTNLLYQFNEDPSVDKIDVVNYPQDPGNVPRLGTNVTPLASLTTSPTIFVPNATDATNIAKDIQDGQQFTITNQTTGAQQIFQFECGADVQLPAYNNGGVLAPAPEGVRNLDEFSLDDGTNLKTFQFISGPVLTISNTMLANINTMTDGDTFTITNKAGASVTFEIDTSPLGTQYNLKDFPINLSKLPTNYTAQDTLNAIIAAINKANIGVQASGYIDANLAEGRISLLDGQLTDGSPWPTVNINGPNANPANKGAASQTMGDDHNSLLSQTAGTIAINYQETESVTTLGGQMEAAVSKNMPLITPSYADRGSGLAGRITFWVRQPARTSAAFRPSQQRRAVPSPAASSRCRSARRHRGDHFDPHRGADQCV